MRAFKPVPLTLQQANSLVRELHRHHKPARGHRFSIGAMDQGGKIVGAVMVGRPVSRGCDPYTVAEVIRLVTDGTKNACSFLYGVAARIAQAMGFAKIQTYILDTEPGTSLRAAGWTKEIRTKTDTWNTPSRRGRRTDQPHEAKQRWAKAFNEHRKAAA